MKKKIIIPIIPIIIIIIPEIHTSPKQVIFYAFFALFLLFAANNDMSNGKRVLAEARICGRKIKASRFFRTVKSDRAY